MSKHVLVTGGNSGIGLALCKLLATEHSCHVYLGSRSVEKGTAARQSIVEQFPEAASTIEVVQIDVSDDTSCTTAASAIKAKGVTLYGLVNNAGIGLAQAGEEAKQTEALLNTNFLGPKRVTEAFVGVLDAKEGRVVNTASGAASMWLRNQDEATKALFSNPEVSFEQIDKACKVVVEAGDVGFGAGYGFSKAALVALTMVQAKAYPHLTISSMSPGFIDTPMTKGFGAKLTPEQGCISAIKCLFGDVTTGYYYGSDGLRSPLTCTRDPGTPEYEGEQVPDPAKYNK